MDLNIGDLVTSEEFLGIGKIISLDEIEYIATVAFFESPLKHEVRPLELKHTHRYVNLYAPEVHTL